MTAQDTEVFVRSLYELYNSHQSDPGWLEKGMAAYAADSTLTNVPLGVTLPGPEGFKQLMLFFAGAFPDSRVEITHVLATEEQAVVEFTGRGTNTGPLHLPAGDILATGRRTELRICEVFQIRDGKIISQHSYYDMMTMLQQLGVIPAPGQAPS